MESFSRSRSRSWLDRYFSYIENRPASDRVLLLLFGALLLGSLIYGLFTLNAEYKTTVPTAGGTLTEGIVGTPRFINPVLAITRADQDVAALIYSGLMHVDVNGELTPDLAKDITVSDDGLVYNVTLRDDIYFHDGTPVTATDVAYTIGLIQDPTLKSPLRGNWTDVTVEVIGDHELNFVLSEPFTPFIENLTVGILPKHIWYNLSIEQFPFSQHNTNPIGSGPYQIDSIKTNTSGLIDSFTLRAADRPNEDANISELILRFYQNEELLVTALDEGIIDSTASLSYDTLSHINTETYTVSTYPLPRVFAVFFNQNKSAILRDQAVRDALDIVIDKEDLVRSVLGNYGQPADSPIPPGFFTYASTTADTAPTSTTRLRRAQEILLAGDWEQQEDGSWIKEIDDTPTTLSFTVTTANSDIFDHTAQYLERVWGELGAQVSIARYEQTDLIQANIRPRNYEALLFGAEVGRQLDLYPFWHSSQKDDPGLNVSLYANISTDALLETARTTQDTAEQHDALEEIAHTIQTERPAIFLFTPAFTYVTRDSLSMTTFDRLIRPSERFSNIPQWHISESDVWPIFTQ